jgi:DNA (cytosine-5)-methyltransferase 1
MTFNIISTFSGVAGSSLGYKLAGGSVKLAVEWDQNAVDCYKLNFPTTPIYPGDIANLSVEQAWEMSGLKPGTLDLFDGSPPCQGFSTAGKRDFSDSRNQLFKQYVRLLKGLQPKVMIMENVSGMVKGKMKVIFAEAMKELKACGYNVKAKLLNAQYYNVPQSRQRLIFIGIRNDLNIEPTFPKPQTRPITLREALAKPINKEGDVYAKLSGKYGKMMDTMVRPGGKLSDVHPKGSGFNYIKLRWDKPCCTIPKSVTYSGAVLWHPEGPPLTGRELQRLASYPDDFKFIGTYSDWNARIGNSVPPNFMRAIAEHVRDNVLLIS